MQNLSDLDELVLRCRSDASRTYIREAVGCYYASANRAAVSTVWISVVFDLIDKIKELSITGNGAAISLIEQFEKYQQNIDRGDETSVRPALEFERNLLERARTDFELLDAQQYQDLARIRDDRHRCVHPTFQQTGAPYTPQGCSVFAGRVSGVA